MRILFTCWNAFSDPYNGSAHSCAIQGRLLAESGEQVKAITAAKLAQPLQIKLEELVQSLGVDAAERFSQGSRLLVNTIWHGVDVGIVCTAQPKLAEPDRSDSNNFIAHFQRILRDFRPHITHIVGSENILQEAARLAKKAGSKVVYLVDTEGLDDRKYFAQADRVLATTHALGQKYYKSLGLRTYVIHPLIDEPQNLITQGAHDELVAIYPDQSQNVEKLKSVLNDVRASNLECKISVYGKVPPSEADYLGKFNVSFLSQSESVFSVLGRARLVLDLRDFTAFNDLLVKSHLNGIPCLTERTTGAIEIMGETDSCWDTNQLATEIKHHFDDLAFYSDRVVAARHNFEQNFCSTKTKNRLLQYFQALHQSAKSANGEVVKSTVSS